jgi:hypothetical protein
MLDQWNDALTPNKLENPHATTHDSGDEVVVRDVEEHSRAWVIHYASRRWVETRAFRDLLVGACPIVIGKATGETYVYGSAEYEKFQSWLDSDSGT